MESRTVGDPLRRVTLRISASPAAAWREVLLPWFRAAAADAIGNPQPTLVVVPFRSHAYWHKTLLLAEDISLLGVRFVSPAEIRELLSAKAEIRLPLREHLRLLLAIAAEQRMESSGASEQTELLAARSVMRAPDHLLRAFDQIGAAGWNFAEMGPPNLRGVVLQFERLANECGFSFVHIADRAAAARAQQGAPLFANVLITGFNAAHWPLWPLLEGAVLSSRAATVLLDEPRDEARDLDQAWIGTWEEAFGEAGRVHDDSAGAARFVGAQATFDFAVEKPREKTETHFLVGSNTTEQARAIVAMAVKFVSAGNCDRLGILFAAPGALARTVAVLLADAGISHNDGIAHLAPGPFEEAVWNAWLELQENPLVEVLLRFLKHHAQASEWFGNLSLRRIEQTLRGAYRDVLIDDLEVLREYCARNTDRADSRVVAEGIAALRFLPARAALREFLSATREIFLQLGWIERWAEVERLSKSWSASVAAEFSRRTYLRWLAELTQSSFSVRDRAGDHPYSRVHLLPYGEAEGQCWSHLIFTGLNEGQWPPRNDESGFLREEDIDALNDRVATLNRRSTRQGRQGEGHETAREGKTLFVGPLQGRQIAARQFANLLERAERGLGACASLFQESAPDRLWNPSEHLTRLYFSERAKALSHGVMAALQRETRAWLDRAALFHSDRGAGAGVEQTRVAFAARRQEKETAGEYEFALREPLERSVVLRVTDWEKTMRSPALIWMKIFLGVEGTEENFNAWSLATGQWAHRWLARISDEPASNRFTPLPDRSEIRRRPAEAAFRFRAEIEELCARVNRPLPDWWTSGWRNAFYLADCLAARIAELQEWPRLATEWTLDPANPIALGDGEQLSVRGRVDLILSRDQNEKDLWLIDYKTGGRKTLTPTRWKTSEDRAAKVRKKLRSGDAVQLGLYALAMNAIGANDVALSLLSPPVELDRPQLRLADIEAQIDFWKELHRMQESGVFGMLGAVRSEFSFSAAYPLATLAVDTDLLNRKWALTHPAFAEGDEGE